MILQPLWTFTEFVQTERRQEMVALKGFDEVIDQLTAGSIECCKFEPHENYPYGRAFIKVHVGKEATTPSLIRQWAIELNIAWALKTD